MVVVKIVEIMGTSTKSMSDALEQAVSRACRTLRNVRGADMISYNVVIRDGKIREHRVTLKVAFGLEEK